MGLGKYFPHLRVLPEEHAETAVSLDGKLHNGAVVSETVFSDGVSSEFDDKKVVIAGSSDDGTVVLRADIPYELRDESGRKWWKYFDEYEYRFNKQYILGRKWYEFLYPNHTTQSPAERTLLYKLDLIVGMYLMVLCWCKSVDSNNLTNSYISGMHEDLKMKGNDLVYTSTIANIGSIVFQLPFMYFLPRYPSVYILPIMDLGWSLFTVLCATVKNLAQLKAYRFILYAFGGAYYPVSQYVMGCWYAPDEISSRVCLFFFGQILGRVTAGFLQARLIQSLDNVLGLPGWRWMFLIDGLVISIHTAVVGYFVLPGVPSKCYSLFLTDEEIRIARERNKRNQIKDSVSNTSQLSSLLSLKLWKKVLFAPTLWILLLYDMFSWCCMTAYSGGWELMLDEEKRKGVYSVIAINNLSSIPASVGLGYLVICALGSDLFRSKWFFIVFGCLMHCIACAILIKWDVPKSVQWLAYMMTYWSIATTPCLWAFINDFLRHDPQVKAISWIIIYSVSQSTYNWVSVLVWKTVDAPQFKLGYRAAFIFTFLLGAWTFVILYFYKKNERKVALDNRIILYNTKKGIPIPSYVDTLMIKKGAYYYLKETYDVAKEPSPSKE
ncbi:Vht1p Ecym_2758 [Eremothecium cymbalariae DBVPG|uniref:Major facilitator superfamily (MFS) profile domain-containing protein n=1 Tax=Eremothecium cymbalariae (strain CBS 270.75 / DBVPG 7215 / KCTC 17166 / NRRL Y-17582) TaxID=931890 RepID=G8JPZ4_ERECY|nr:Hypothetical protein Ecym_2758 [Eremothecium cymbalariae DBVPG\